LDLIDVEAKMKKLANISNPIQTITQRLLSSYLIQDEANMKKLANMSKEEDGVKCGSPVLRPFLNVDPIY
jgi:hypothetical protein